MLGCRIATRLLDPLFDGARRQCRLCLTRIPAGFRAVRPVILVSRWHSNADVTWRAQPRSARAVTMPDKSIGLGGAFASKMRAPSHLSVRALHKATSSVLRAIRLSQCELTCP